MKKFLALLLAMVMVLAFVPAANAASLGDVNGDGAINSRDIAAIQKDLVQIKALSSEARTVADVNSDGRVNSRDMAAIQKHILRISIIGDEDLIKLEHGETVAVDLDADGNKEYVKIELSNGGLSYDINVVLSDRNGTKLSSYDCGQGYDYNGGENFDTNFYIAKLEPNSDKKTVIVTYEDAVGDLVTKFLKYNSGSFSEIPYYINGEYVDEGYCGFVSLNSDKTMNMLVEVECLGTYRVLEKWQLKNGAIEVTDDNNYYDTGAKDIWDILKVTKAVPAVLIENGAEKRWFIPVGEEIYITGFTADFSRAYFSTEDDSMSGYINMEDNNGWKIAGISEWDYFEDLPYRC